MIRPSLRSRARYTVFIFSMLLLFGCANQKSQVKNKEVTFPKVNQNKISLKPLERPLLRADFSTLAKKEHRKFDLVLRKAPLGEVLRTLLRERGYNLVFGKDVPVDEPVTVELRKVTLFQALDVLSKSLGFVYVVDGNTVWIMRGDIGTEIFKLGLLNISRGMQVSSSISSGTTGTEEGASSGSFSVQVFAANKLSVWNDVGCNICSLIGLTCSKSTGGLGSVVELCSSGKKFVAINRSTGHVIVTAEKIELKRVEEYIKSVKASLDKQVVLDVKIAEVELKKGLQIGIDWQKVFNNVFRSKYSVTFHQLSQPTSEISPVTPYFTMTVSSSITARDPFNMVVRALEQYGTVNVISSPRLAVVNNQGAVIKVGEDMRFVTDVSSTTNTETNTIGCDVDTETFFVGVSLSLVPYVDEKGVITIYVHPNVTELKDVRTFRSECGDVPVEEPEFYVREMDTVVKLMDGETLIIGGLIERRNSTTKYKTPLFSDIPLVGNLFTRHEKTSGRTELFVFITPHVIYNPYAPKASIGSYVNADIVGTR